MVLRLATGLTLLLLIGILAFQNPDMMTIQFISEISLPISIFTTFILFTGILIGKLLPESDDIHKPTSRPGNHSAATSSNLFVGNLARNTRKDDLKATFSKYGTVRSVKIITDKHSGNPKGYGFVEMKDEPGAIKAIKNLNGYELCGKLINVNAAHPRTENHRGRSSGRRGYR